MSGESLKALVGKRLAEVRDSVGLNQRELAERLEGHKQTISDYENGRGNLSLERLEEIADALGVDPVTLVTLDTDDYRSAMEEAATIVEGTMSDLVRELRSRAEVPGTGVNPAKTSDESEEGRAS